MYVHPQFLLHQKKYKNIKSCTARIKESYLSLLSLTISVMFMTTEWGWVGGERCKGWVLYTWVMIASLCAPHHSVHPARPSPTAKKPLNIKLVVHLLSDSIYLLFLLLCCVVVLPLHSKLLLNFKTTENLTNLANKCAWKVSPLISTINQREKLLWGIISIYQWWAIYSIDLISPFVAPQWPVSAPWQTQISPLQEVRGD